MLFRSLAKQVFSERKNRAQDGAFKASNLEKAIKETIELKLGKGHANDKMIMPDTVLWNCKTYVSFYAAISAPNNAGY